MGTTYGTEIISVAFHFHCKAFIGTPKLFEIKHFRVPAFNFLTNCFHKTVASHGLCKNLGFSAEDRAENIRRVGEVSKLMADSGMVTLVALVSPYRADRDAVRKMVEEIGAAFIEIYVEASVNTCESRDPKGLYKMAREGKIKGFTGIDDPYEEPNSPELTLDSNCKSVNQLAQEACAYIRDKIKL